ncbi:response regulator transcription factor [Denitromonas iodatirespirans]|uniref:Response regulator transcription factor n=1 Tax=Denitromonas iodatirespirans TaxID=2795389 RepID=A0A944DC24_DENI1|nr:response regulator transcription factor [Denitromonas iodatirespirans]MBT0961753.1 response regulator transcription factor [Denitromonas iodatirespirans]
MSEPAAPRVVLIVDDIPDNLALLHDALDAAGYAVLVATDGPSALARAARQQPDVILLDALMPGMDGFEVARRLKADFGTAHIPIVFMTGLTETEHVVAAFDAGGIDYVTKPIRPPEVLARIAAHMHGARQMSLARNALDASGQATVAVRLSTGALVWQTPLARRLLADFLGTETERAPRQLLQWIESAAATRSDGRAPLPLSLSAGDRRLTFNLHEQTPDGEWLLGLREESDRASIDALLPAFGLTAREAEVLYWVSKGKTNRDVGDILGLSPRTVHKHLEHIFAKLGVETRTAAATLAINKLKTGGD